MNLRRRPTLDDPVKKLIGYVRVSKVAGRHDERFKSPELQRKVMRQWAEVRYGKGGHRWIEWFEELDRTGTSIDRPELNKARDLAITEQADIIVYDLARYSRSVPEGLTALKSLEEFGVRVVSATEDIDASTPDGELTLTLFLAMNQHFARRMAHSWKRSIEANRSAGWWHGTVPYGYRKPTDAEVKKIGRRSGVIVPDAKARRHVEEIFRRYLAGESIYAIGRYAVAQGWFLKDGTAREIVANPVYAGFVRLVQTAPARSKKDGRILKDKNGRVRNLAIPGSERYYRGQHTPLVSARDLVRARQRLARDYKPAAPRSMELRWSAAGRTKCFTCGRSLAFHDKSKQLQEAAGIYLTCTARHCTARPGSVKIQQFEGELAALISSLPLQVADVAAELRARQAAERDSGAPARAQLEAERTKLKRKLAGISSSIITGDFADLGLAEDEARLALQVTRADLAECERKLDALGPVVSIRDDLQQLAEQIDALANLWPKMTVNERVAALEALGALIKVKPARKHNDGLDGRLVLSLPFDPTAEFSSRLAEQAESAGTKPKTVAAARPRVSPQRARRR